MYIVYNTYNVHVTTCEFCHYFTEFQRIYDRLGVTIIERGESFYQPLMPIVVKDLEEKGKPLLLDNNYHCLLK